ncbi:MAG: molecular chaperone HtpG [Bacteroidia bacterium]|nr:molecular chaperone HtpG [Bacteroidia bacterium]
MERGNISVSTENIFPIIKKSLYSEQEIFLRELISNAVDATQKLKFLSSRGEFQGELGELKIRVKLDNEAKTLTVSDSGLGMTAEEVKKYLNQVAFSGAEEFLKKFQDAKEKEDIIGRFGLGFYSAFMVASQVEVISKSWQEGAEAVRWICDGTTEFTLDSGERETRGTDVILHISEADEEYLESVRIRSILDKYCKFLPIEIEFEEEIINNPNPIWKKTPADLDDKAYQDFFRELYPYADDPLFWIHLNVDYPFNLTGILYFPKIRQDIDPRKNNIQLYSRQVFITDEVSQIVPDYLMLLQGVIDSPDIPLNVSRSYLQGDSSVKQISSYITRKVADKLHEIYKEDRGKFEEKWRDISVFVKYGMITDEKFYEKAEKFCLLENMDGNFYSLTEYQDKITPTQTDKDGKRVYLYATDKRTQDMFIHSAQEKGYDVLHMNGVIDNHFMQQLERKLEKSRWARVDSDILEKLIPKEVSETDSEEKPKKGKKKKTDRLLSEDEEKKVKESFEKVTVGKKGLTVQTERLGADQLPVMITRPEFMRRMKEMAAVGGGGMGYFGEMPDAVNVVVNTQHPLVQSIADAGEDSDMAKQLLDLALLSQNMLEGRELTDFIRRSVEMLQK